MKVMHIIHGLSVGGAETLVKEYALNLDKNLFEVVILCFEHFYDSPYEKILADNKIKVIYVCDDMKFYNKKQFLYKAISFVQRYMLIKKYINKEKPDIIHTHLSINKYIKFASPKKGTRIFHTMHGEPRRYQLQNPKDFEVAKWLVNKYNMRFICLHDKMRKEVNEIFNVNNSVVINNGIDLKKYEMAISKKEIRKKINIPEDAYVIGHLGRFDKVKNHELLVDIFNEIHKKNDKAFLLMIGIGSTEHIEDKLNLYGLKDKYMILANRTDIPDLLNAMDIFVFPSISEGLGISLIEAQIMKLPCFISSNIPEHAIISNLVTIISLSESASYWAKKILSYKIPEKVKINSEDWDMKKSIKKLESLYLSKE